MANLEKQKSTTYHNVICITNGNISKSSCVRLILNNKWRMCLVCHVYVWHVSAALQQPAENLKQ